MKKIHEMNKQELRAKVIWIKKEVYKFRKGEALQYEYESFAGLLAWREMAFNYIHELRQRGLAKADRERIDAFFTEYHKADKMLEQKLNF